MTAELPDAERSPNLARLGERLHELRESAGINQTVAGQHINRSQGKISRAETGRFPLSVEDVRKLAELYGASDKVARELAALADELRVGRADSRLVFQRGDNHFQTRVREAEEDARLVRSYQPGIVIGSVQIEDYATAVFGQSGRPGAAEKLRERLERGRLMLSDRSREWVLIHTEGALRWPVHSAAVMGDQIEHLITISRLPNVRIGLLDQSTPLSFTAAHGFHLYDDTKVHIGTKTAAALTSDQRDLDAYNRLFGLLEQSTLWGDEARAALLRIADGYGRRRLVGDR